MPVLSPDPDAPAVAWPSRQWQLLPEPPDTVELDALHLPARPARMPLRVRTGHFTVNAMLDAPAVGDRLVVTFHGARGGKRLGAGRQPMFFRSDFGALYGGPILALSDPQTELDWNSHLPRVGMYAGTFEHDLVPELLRLVERVREQLGVPAHRVVMVGSSAGGSAAMLVAARRGAGTGVIAVAPFLRPDRYRPPLVAAAARAAGGTLDDWRRGVVERPERFHPLVAVRRALHERRDLRLVVAQNTADAATLHRHFPALWRRFDIDPEGGVSPNGRVMAVLFESAATGRGHGPEPDELAAPLLRTALAFFDTPAPRGGPAAPIPTAAEAPPAARDEPVAA